MKLNKQMPYDTARQLYRVIELVRAILLLLKLFGVNSHGHNYANACDELQDWLEGMKE